MDNERWLLPDGVEDLLPPQAKRVENVRRNLLDLFERWGYDYVIPPIVEYLESLLTGTGKDLDLLTFKTVDLLSGRTMGIRADITPQVARIDAHSLGKPGIQRLCYAGTTVRSNASSIFSSRTPISAGAEFFGDASENADAEIVSLMIESLTIFGFSSIQLNLGNVEIFRRLIGGLGVSLSDRDRIFQAVQKKATNELREICIEIGLPEEESSIVQSLPDLCGNAEILTAANKLFSSYPDILESVESLEKLYSIISKRYSEIDIYFDLSELRGFAYHTGVVFSANLKGNSDFIAKGGRYDHIGGVFGRDSREATGFSIDVVNLSDLLPNEEKSKESILVIPSPEGFGKGLWKKTEELRAKGYIVVESGDPENYELLLRYEAGEWQMISGKKL
jgi:ATP phosphoribosyltransferase regulatory subunit